MIEPKKKKRLNTVDNSKAFNINKMNFFTIQIIKKLPIEMKGNCTNENSQHVEHLFNLCLRLELDVMAMKLN